MCGFLSNQKYFAAFNYSYNAKSYGVASDFSGYRHLNLTLFAAFLLSALSNFQEMRSKKTLCQLGRIKKYGFQLCTAQVSEQLVYVLYPWPLWTGPDTLWESICSCSIYTFLKVFLFCSVVSLCSPHPLSPLLVPVKSFLFRCLSSQHFQSRSVSFWVMICWCTFSSTADVIWRLHLACQWCVTPSLVTVNNGQSVNLETIFKGVNFLRTVIDDNTGFEGENIEELSPLKQHKVSFQAWNN